MPPIRQQKEHQWTDFELHAMLCLITKGVHLEGYGKVKRSDDPNVIKRNAYLTFATTLNNTLHGTNYEHDIPKKEVTRKLDELLLQHKAIIGKGGMAERQFGGRVTRALRLTWKRSLGHGGEVDKDAKRVLRVPCSLDFDGSISEWNQWRRKAVENKRRARSGLPPLEVVAEGVEQTNRVGQQDTDRVVRSRVSTADQKQKPPGRNKWRSQQKNALSEEYIVDEADQGKIPTMPSEKIIPTKLDAYRTLPANVRSSGKFQWANPDARQQAFLGGLRGSAAIAAFQTAGMSSQGGEYRGTARGSSHYEPYVPPTLSRPSRFGSSARAQGSSESVPSLTHEYESSDDIDAAANTPVEINYHPSHLFSSDALVHGANDGYATGSIASKGVGAELTTSAEGSGEKVDLEMAGTEEGEIWADLEAARGY